MKPRICPHCKKRIGIDTGYDFDKNCSLVCGFCKKVVVPTIEKDEPKPYFAHKGTPPYGGDIFLRGVP